VGTAVGGSARTRVRRSPELAVHERAALDAILDEGLVAHVGVVDARQPFVLPSAFVRDGDRLLLHGSTGSRLFRSLAAGMPACVTVTLLDGLVYARSVFHSTMNYRCAVVLGRGCAVPEDGKEEALRLLSERLLPGRWGEARPPSRKELAATLVVAVPLEEASVKVSAGLPDVAPEDADWETWSGVVPLSVVAGPAQSCDGRDVPPHVAAVAG
jgi:nitroimidazol reductase NimA-like FMN-containing flavoprotein (pyridoxamine 5'-phosphate oxidase superfamily)